ncbi:Solute carrier family 2, facilitated glucose transporter member 4 [Liparis tanakae]|uniref:Solute carrier family 2, facilitated glucose transporter member 4 n=1 Tax=Liparis tanakae TaxID=230148 RepID=A0A4Z2IRY3_9TELE|nr:Solute carrier family 2, facilitated glucose transporter member 4 [Liparis tanakae]
MGAVTPSPSCRILPVIRRVVSDAHTGIVPSDENRAGEPRRLYKISAVTSEHVLGGASDGSGCDEESFTSTFIIQQGYATGGIADVMFSVRCIIVIIVKLHDSREGRGLSPWFESVETVNFPAIFRTSRALVFGLIPSPGGSRGSGPYASGPYGLQGAWRACRKDGSGKDGHYNQRPNHSLSQQCPALKRMKTYSRMFVAIFSFVAFFEMGLDPTPWFIVAKLFSCSPALCLRLDR